MSAFVIRWYAEREAWVIVDRETGQEVAAFLSLVKAERWVVEESKRREARA